MTATNNTRTNFHITRHVYACLAPGCTLGWTMAYIVFGLHWRPLAGQQATDTLMNINESGTILG